MNDQVVVIRLSLAVSHFLTVPRLSLLYLRHDDVLEELWDWFGEHENKNLEGQHRHTSVSVLTARINVLFTETEHARLERPLLVSNIITVSDILTRTSHHYQLSRVNILTRELI